MKRIQILCLVMVLSGAAATWSCKKKPEPEPVPTTGIVHGKISDAGTNAALADARIIAFNANENSPVGVATSDAAGNYSFTLNPGNYYLKVYRQGYEQVPMSDAGIVPFGVNAGDDLVKDYALNPLPNSSSLGSISGKVTVNGNAEGGALVVAENGSTGYSALTGPDGSYSIFNVPAGSWSVNAWMAGNQGTAITSAVTAGQLTANQDIAMTASTGGALSGKVTFLATDNVEVDVSLVHPITKETIPGLTTKTTGYVYNISNVPNGMYFARASFANDTKVMDPDWILKFGQPSVTINGAPGQLDFSVTGAMTLTSPTNELSSVKPVDVSPLPTLTWQPYASATHYVIEVVNSRGQVIWGGIEGMGNSAVRKVLVPKTTLNVMYNFDGTATESLRSGQIYRWRVYASKDENSTLGWKLISASEDQVGLIKVM
jgi:hypothetical protein